jgi:hypothetical protein
MRIKSVEDIRPIENKLVERLLEGNLTYFSLVFVEEDEISNCCFTPTSRLPAKDTMIFVGDYGKLLKILLSHPNISDIGYDEKDNAVTAIFESPYPADRGEEEEEF